MAEALESADRPQYNSPGGHPSPTTDLGTTQPPTAGALALFSGPAPTSDAVSTVASALTTNTTQPASQPSPVTTSGGGTADDSTGSAGPAHSVVVAAATARPISSSTDADGTKTKKDEKTKKTDAGEKKGQKNSEDKDAEDKDSKDQPAVTDMGKVGEWRPGDIANMVTAVSRITGSIPDLLDKLGSPLQAVGETVKDFGEAFKDVVGGDGITGLVKEGVDAAEHIDKLVEHHTDPAGVPDNDHPAGTGTGTAGPPTAQPAKAALSDSDAPQQRGVAVSANHAPVSGGAPSATITGASAAVSEAPSHGAPATPSGGFFGAPGSTTRGEQDGEHRPKIRYTPAERTEPAAEDEPEEPETRGRDELGSEDRDDRK
ncbi:hypothetical protein [Nocardia spumae]|uniref:hypothetical protein n=1 Tax=Nocardia spumae TaxID=2887190 RepID=UPI001D14D72D|nr:hypothetical protein [Nocardia spumae]